jgi:hypothetical protein
MPFIGKTLVVCGVLLDVYLFSHLLGRRSMFDRLHKMPRLEREWHLNKPLPGWWDRG